MINGRLLFLVLFILFSTISCGGGGGGSDATESPLDGRNEALLEEAAETFLYGLSYTESAVQLAQSGIKHVLDTQAKLIDTTAYIEELCLTGSTIVTHTDGDSDLEISSGDQFSQESMDCDSTILQGIALGTVIVKIKSFSTQNDGRLNIETTIDYQPGFQILSGGELVFISGEIRVTYELSSSGEKISIYDVEENRLELLSEGLVERIVDMEIIKIAPLSSTPFADNVELSANIEIESDVLSSTINCSANNISFIKGDHTSINSFSDFMCQGEFGESRLKGNNIIAISLPDESSFTETYTFFPGDVFEGPISSEAFFDLEDFSY